MHSLQRVFIKFRNRIAGFAPHPRPPYPGQILMNFYRAIICKWCEWRKQILLPRALATVGKAKESSQDHAHALPLFVLAGWLAGRMRMRMRMVHSPGSCADIYIGKQLRLPAPFIYCPAILVSSYPGTLASLVSWHELLINQRRPATTTMALAADIKPEPAPRSQKIEVPYGQRFLR